MIPVETSAVVGLMTLLVNQLAALWRSESRYHRERAERKEQEERASKERRRMVHQLRYLRPDVHCARRGCPLTTGPDPAPRQRDNLRVMGAQGD